MTVESTLRELRALADGLLYTSEGDHPFEVVHFRDPKAGPPDEQRPLTAERARELLGIGADVPHEVVTLEHVLGRHTVFTYPDDIETQRIRPRYEALQAYLERELRDVIALRTGRSPVIDVWLVGHEPLGDVVGFHTIAIET